MRLDSDNGRATIMASIPISEPKGMGVRLQGGIAEFKAGVHAKAAQGPVRGAPVGDRHYDGLAFSVGTGKQRQRHQSVTNRGTLGNTNEPEGALSCWMARPKRYDPDDDQMRLVDSLHAEEPMTWQELSEALGWSRFRLKTALTLLVKEGVVQVPLRGPKGTRIYCTVFGGPLGDVTYRAKEIALTHSLLERHRVVLEFVRDYPHETWDSLLTELDNTRQIPRRATRKILCDLETWDLVRRRRELSVREEDLKWVPLAQNPPIGHLTLYEALGPPSNPHKWSGRRSERSRRKEERDHLRKVMSSTPRSCSSAMPFIPASAKMLLRNPGR